MDVLPKAERFASTLPKMSEAERQARLREIEAMADDPLPLEQALLLMAEYLELEDWREEPLNT